MVLRNYTLQQSHFKRSVAGALAMVLALTGVPPPSVWAQPSSSLASHAPSATSLPSASLDLSSLSIPDALGHVAQTWQPQDEAPRGFVIHLQDLHVHPDAQRHLAELIGYLHDHWGISLVAVEGASGLCDTALYSDFPDPPSTERIARLFLKEGLFTGSEYYAITHPGTVSLWGVEDEAAYLEHLKAYQEGAVRITESDAVLARLRDGLLPLKASLYPKPLLKLQALREAYEQDDGALRPYFDELRKQAKRDLSAYPHLDALAKAFALYQHIDMPRVKKESDQLLARLKTQLMAAERERLSVVESRVNTREEPAERYYATLAELATTHGVSFRDDSRSFASSVLRPFAFSALRTYLAYLTASEQIRSPALSDELDALQEAVEQALLTTEAGTPPAGGVADGSAERRSRRPTDAQRTLARLLKDVELLDGLIHVKLSPRSFHDYQSRRSSLTADALAEALRRVTPKVPVSRAELAQLLETLPAHEHFYDLALKRDDTLARNTVSLLSRPTSDLRPQTSDLRAVILITGGFHTPGITERLKAQGIAYAVITPSSSGAMDDARYRARLNDEIPPLHDLIEQLDRQTLVPPLATFSPGPSGEQPDDHRQPPNQSPARREQASPSAKKHDETFARWVGAQANELLARVRGGYEKLQVWIGTHPHEVQLYGIALTGLALSVMGTHLQLDATPGAVGAMTISSGSPESEQDLPEDITQSPRHSPVYAAELLRLAVGNADNAKQLIELHAGSRGTVWATADGRYVLKVFSDRHHGAERYALERLYAERLAPEGPNLVWADDRERALVLPNYATSDNERLIDYLQSPGRTLEELTAAMVTAAGGLARHHGTTFADFESLVPHRPSTPPPASYFDLCFTRIHALLDRLRAAGLPAPAEADVRTWEAAVNADRPYVLTHSDYSPWNIFVRRDTGALVRVIDGESITNAPATRDVAIAIIGVLETARTVPLALTHLNALIAAFVHAYEQARGVPVNQSTLPFHLAARCLSDAIYEITTHQDRDVAAWHASLASYFFTLREPDLDHLIPVESVEFIHRPRWGETPGDHINVAGTFTKWSLIPMPWDDARGAYRLTLQLPVGTYDYRFVQGGRWFTDPQALTSGPNSRLNVTSVRALLAQQFEALRQAGQRPLLSTDMDDTWVPYGVPASDADLTRLIAYLEADGELAVNTLADRDWFYYRVLGRLVDRLARERKLHLLEQFHLLLRTPDGAHQLYRYDAAVGGYRLVERLTPGHKAEALVRLVALLGGRAGLCAAYGDQFGDAWNDGSLRGHPEIPLVVNVGRAVEPPDGSQRFINAIRRGPQGMAQDVEFLTGLLRQSSTAVVAGATASASAVPEVLQSWDDTQPVEMPSGGVLVKTADRPGFLWTGINRGSAWDHETIVPLIRRTDGIYGARIPLEATVYTVFWLDANQPPPGQWASRDFSIPRPPSAPSAGGELGPGTPGAKGEAITVTGARPGDGEGRAGEAPTHAVPQVPVAIPTPLRPYTNKQETVTVEGRTLGELIDDLIQLHPDVRIHLVADDLTLRPQTHLFVDDADVTITPAQRATWRSVLITSTSRVALVPAIPGGSGEGEEPQGAPDPTTRGVLPSHHETTSEPGVSLRADLNICLAVAAHNRDTNERALAHILPSEHQDLVVEGHASTRPVAKTQYLDEQLRGIRGEAWDVTVVSAVHLTDVVRDTNGPIHPDDIIVVKDLVGYLQHRGRVPKEHIRVGPAMPSSAKGRHVTIDSRGRVHIEDIAPPAGQPAAGDLQAVPVEPGTADPAHVAQAQALLKRLGIGPGSRVVDVGPGNPVDNRAFDLTVPWGWLSVRAGSELIVYEPQPDSNTAWQRTADRWNALPGSGRVEVVPVQEADFTGAQLPDGSVDLVVMDAVVTAPDITPSATKALLERALRALQPGGTLLVSWFEDLAIDNVWAELRRIEAETLPFHLRLIAKGSDPRGGLGHRWRCYEVSPAAGQPKALEGQPLERKTDLQLLAVDPTGLEDKFHGSAVREMRLNRSGELVGALRFAYDASGQLERLTLDWFKEPLAITDEPIALDHGRFLHLTYEPGEAPRMWLDVPGQPPWLFSGFDLTETIRSSHTQHRAYITISHYTRPDGRTIPALEAFDHDAMSPFVDLLNLPADDVAIIFHDWYSDDRPMGTLYIGNWCTDLKTRRKVARITWVKPPESPLEPFSPGVIDTVTTDPTAVEITHAQTVLSYDNDAFLFSDAQRPARLSEIRQRVTAVVQPLSQQDPNRIAGVNVTRSTWSPPEQTEYSPRDQSTFIVNALINAHQFWLGTPELRRISGVRLEPPDKGQRPKMFGVETPWWVRPPATTPADGQPAAQGVELFTAEEREEIRARGAILKQIYPQLSLAAKRVLLEPTLLPVIMGVKPGYRRMARHGELTDPQVLAEELQRLPEIPGAPALLINDEHLVDTVHFGHTIVRHRAFLERRGVIHPDEDRSQLEELAALDATRSTWTTEQAERFGELTNEFFVHFYERSANSEGATAEESANADSVEIAFYGVLMGYPEETILVKSVQTREELAAQLERHGSPFPKVTLYPERRAGATAAEAAERYLARMTEALYYAYSLIPHDEEFSTLARELGLPADVLARPPLAALVRSAGPPAAMADQAIRLADPGGKAEAAMTLQGARVTSYQVEGRELLKQFGSPKDEGIFLAWPWANRLREASLRVDGRPADLTHSALIDLDANRHPIHGMARNARWNVIAQGDAPRSGSLRLGLAEADAATIHELVGPLVPELTYEVRGRQLSCALTVANPDSVPHAMSAAFHATYEAPQGSRVQLPADASWKEDDHHLPLGPAPVPVDGTIFDLRQPTSLDGLELDRVFTDLQFDADGWATSILFLPDGARLVVRQDRGFSHLVVWVVQGLIAIEPQTSPTATQLPVAPGEVFRAHMTVEHIPAAGQPAADGVEGEGSRVKGEVGPAVGETGMSTVSPESLRLVDVRIRRMRHHGEMFDHLQRLGPQAVLVNFDAHEDLGASLGLNHLFASVEETNWAWAALRRGLVRYYVHIPPRSSLWPEGLRAQQPWLPSIWTVKGRGWMRRVVELNGEDYAAALQQMSGSTAVVTIDADAYSLFEEYHTPLSALSESTQPLVQFVQQHALRLHPDIYVSDSTGSSRYLRWVGSQVDAAYLDSLALHLQEALRPYVGAPREGEQDRSGQADAAASAADQPAAAYPSRPTLAPGEIEAVRALLPDPPRGVLYLTGPRGAGKTTLENILVQRQSGTFCHLYRTRPLRDDEPPQHEGHMLPPKEYAAGKAARRLIGEASSSGSSPSALAVEDLKTAVTSDRIIVTESVLTVAAIEQLWPTVRIQEIAVLPIEPTGALDAHSRQELLETLARRLRTRKPAITDEALQRELRQAEERYEGVIAASHPFVVNPEGASSDAVYAQFEPLALHAVEVIDGRSPAAPPAPADVNEGLGQAGQSAATTTEVTEGAVRSEREGQDDP